VAVIGIDLGTTNSSVSVWRNGELVLVPNSMGAFLTPSVVGFDNNGDIVVGAIAKERLITHPDKTVAVFKRLMGSDYTVFLGNKSFSAPELSSLVLRSLKQDVESFLGESVSEAVISVPAYFNENQRVATKLAGELAGLKVRRLINEPTSAALAYGLNDRQQGTFIILDMGGGTFDVSILEYFHGVMEVHASAGDNYLGGEDFVEQMLTSVLSLCEVNVAVLSNQEKQKLYMQLETFKRRIEQVDEDLLIFMAGGKEHRFNISQLWFDKIITPLLLRAKKPIQQALQDANLNISELDDIILVGGATKLKQFRSAITKLFGRLPSSHLNPDTVVALGAGVQAGLIEQNKALDDVVLTDVCPFTLGTGVVDEHGNVGIFLPVIERNSIVPISVERVLVTAHDNQTQMNISVYQGENRLVRNNVFLGAIQVEIPKGKAGSESVKIRYSYDTSGLLEIDTTVISTGQLYTKAIHNSPGFLTDAELEQARTRLEKLKFHPREAEANRLLLARGERMYSMNTGEKREHIGKMLGEFERILSKQDIPQIEKARGQLTAVLNEFDSEEWF